MFCRFCGRQIEENINFCPYCGGELQIMIKEPEKKNVSTIAYIETSEFNALTKILLIISIINLIISVIPISKYLAIAGGSLALVLLVINGVMFYKNKSKYHVFMIILNITLILTNINSFVLYSILK